MNMRLGKHCKGLGLVGWIVVVPVVLIGLVVVAVVFYEGRKAYWDHKITEMCEKDGGIHVFEQVNITDEDIELLGRVNGQISVPIKKLASENSIVYSEATTTYLREWNPRVRRTVIKIVRRSDKKLIASYINNSRVGGDFPTIIGHPTSFSCPDSKIIITELNRIFIVNGDEK